MDPRWTNRLLLVACAGLAIALEACCAARWELSEPGAAALAQARTAPMELDFDGCKLAPPERSLAERAALILADEERAFVDYQDRLTRAITEQERAALTERRDLVLAGIIDQVGQLRGIIDAPAAAGVSSLAIVYTSTDATAAAPAGGRNPSISVTFDHVSSLGPNEMPLGIVLREASARQALAAAVDSMEKFARQQELLTLETRQLLDE